MPDQKELADLFAQTYNVELYCTKNPSVNAKTFTGFQKGRYMPSCLRIKAI
jgi:hypothetical protein